MTSNLFFTIAMCCLAAACLGGFMVLRGGYYPGEGFGWQVVWMGLCLLGTFGAVAFAVTALVLRWLPHVPFL